MDRDKTHGTRYRYPFFFFFLVVFESNGNWKVGWFLSFRLFFTFDCHLVFSSPTLFVFSFRPISPQHSLKYQMLIYRPSLTPSNSSLLNSFLYFLNSFPRYDGRPSSHRIHFPCLTRFRDVIPYLRFLGVSSGRQ